jgi:flagellar biosynthesis chaperone FliJ
MAFQFSLATVLRVRKIAEEREERILQQILYQISQTAQTLEMMNVKIAGSTDSRMAERFKPSNGRTVHVSYGEIQELKRNRVEVEGQMEKLEQLRMMQVKVYDAARWNREMLSDMQDEKRSAYDSDASRREQKTLDDNYIARHRRG